MHDLRLALRSLKRNPVLSGLMVLAIASGIAASLITLTIYHGRSGNPIWWKADQLYAVTLDTRDEDKNSAFTSLVRNPEYPPPQLNYMDAKALYRSDIPVRQVMMFRTASVVQPERDGQKPFPTLTRVTTADFFKMFDVPFIYGGGWTRADDEAPAPVIVLSRYAQRQTVRRREQRGSHADDRQAGLSRHRRDRCLGTPAQVLRSQQRALRSPGEPLHSVGWTEALQLQTAGNTNSTRANAKVGSFQDLLASESVWLQYWVELPKKADLDRYQRFVDNYATDQKKYGRFPRKLNNRILNVDEWMKMRDVVGDETRVQSAVALMFLLVCILNTFGLMLAKFLKVAPISGLRRALGASRMDIVRQHLIEVVVVGLVGGAAGLGLTFLDLRALRALNDVRSPGQDDNPARVALQQSLTHIDLPMFGVALALSLLTGVLAGLYPAWRIGRLTPSTFLKTQ